MTETLEIKTHFAIIAQTGNEAFCIDKDQIVKDCIHYGDPYCPMTCAYALEMQRAQSSTLETEEIDDPITKEPLVC